MQKKTTQLNFLSVFIFVNFIVTGNVFADKLKPVVSQTSHSSISMERSILPDWSVIVRENLNIK